MDNQILIRIDIDVVVVMVAVMVVVVNVSFNVCTSTIGVDVGGRWVTVSMRVL